MIKITKYEDLTGTQKNKYDTFHPILGELALQVVTNLDNRGENAFGRILEKVYKLDKINENSILQYNSSIYEAFKLGETYGKSEIISVIAGIRRQWGLMPFTTRINKLCETELYGLYIVKKEYYEDDNLKKQIFKGYKLICPLSTEE